MPNDIESDVVIVGAGPAGSALAIALAAGGLRVAVVEAAGFPRDKVCGEFLGSTIWPALRRLGVAESVRHQNCPPSVTARVCLPGGLTWERAVAEPEESRPVGLSRARLDHLLADRATELGAQYFFRHRVRNLIAAEPNGRVAGVEVEAVDRPDAGFRIHAPLTVAADGRHSVVVRQSGTTWQAAGPVRVGVKCHLPITPECDSGPAIEMHGFDDGYFGVCRIEAERLNLCGLLPQEAVRAARGDITAAVRRAAPHSRELLGYLDAAAGPVAWKSIPNVRRQRSTAQRDGVLYVGDALRTIDPLSGQGITLALHGALLAAESLLAAWPTSVTARWHRGYAQRFDALFGRQIGRVGWLVGWLQRPGRMPTALLRRGVGRQAGNRLVGWGYRATTTSPAARRWLTMA